MILMEPAIFHCALRDLFVIKDHLTRTSLDKTA